MRLADSLDCFSKVAGMELDDSLNYWQSEFTKLMPVDKFNKQYAYNIRHNYGKEGSRKTYKPFSCQVVIKSSSGANEAHGCPFVKYDVERLTATLSKMGVPSSSMGEIMEDKRGSHHQLGCQKVWMAMHPEAPPPDHVGISHPNEYFQNSRQEIQKNKTS